ncbi:class I SAM-dependent methyltransferase [Sphingomonas morindae]|uniref:Methyltransferase n=1 Tax=Sphingomonas morindae TaxID=1541170 RepID=A0ABY4X4F1_9SPHN|nr:methyltransferase [Sphingomonas morindae]USI71781.1 methyltransferase [Sphingomonas morindae]
MRRLIAFALAATALAPLAAAPKKPAAAGHAPARAAHPAAPRVAADPALAKAIADPGRPDKDRARDRYRHPAQTLAFFGIKPDMTVVEVLPGGGWYSAILAPYLAAGGGHYVAAVPPGKATDSFNALVAGDAARYGKAQVTAFTAGQPSQLVPDGTADLVLTFRNIHNLLGDPSQAGDGNAPQAFADWYRALKPGGVLGIVEHRLPEQMDTAREKTDGYVKQSTVIRLAMAAGFQFAGASTINANPKDDHDHPKGVWTLPPTYSLGDTDREKYAAIGESDRMTLKFVKPAS